MKVINNITIIVAAILCLSACVKADLINLSHPEHGKINSIAVRWSNKDANALCKYSITSSNGYNNSGILTDAYCVVNCLLTPDNYHINIWNEVDHVTVNGTSATADYSSGLLGWFFTGADDLKVEADKDYAVSIDMEQQVRELTLSIIPFGDNKDCIANITATLSGVAGAIDINTGNPIGNAETVNLVFAKNDAEGQYYAVTRLLGIFESPAHTRLTADSEQILTVSITYVSGSPSMQTVTYNLSRQLAGFNIRKNVPHKLIFKTELTSTTAGFAASIDPWMEEGENVNVY